MKTIAEAFFANLGLIHSISIILSIGFVFGNLVLGISLGLVLSVALIILKQVILEKLKNDFSQIITFQP